MRQTRRSITLFFCGGKDTVVSCDSVRSVFLTVTNQPAFFIDELNSDRVKVEQNSLSAQ